MTDLPPPPRPTLEDRPRKRWVQPVLILAILAVVAIVAWLVWSHSGSTGGTAASGAQGKGASPFGGGAAKGGGRGGRFAADPNRPQPVTAVKARLGDVNIVQTGLGTAVASRTATVRPRVDGLLQNIAFSDGQLVKSGQVLAEIDPAPFQVALDQAEGQLARDRAQLENARLDLQRYKTLVAQDSIAGQTADQQAALVKQLEGTVKIDQAQVDNARLQLSYTHITAPIGGRLGLRQVDAGNMVRGSDTNGIAVITQVQPIGVLFTIPQDILPAVLKRIGSGDKLPVEAWDRDQKELLSRGVLVSTDNQIDVTTGTVKLKAEFPNPDGKLFPNQFVNVRMVVDTLRGAVVVPSAGIQRNTQGAFVWVVRDDGTATLRPVNTGPTEGLDTAIESGVKPGERVITDGVDRIREGAKVEVVEPGAPAPAAGVRDAPAEPAEPGKGDRKGKGKGRRGAPGKAGEGQGAQ
ncbi:MAG TPA: MdtA/MuxA family multidrug efflux RND transporter periplasmic adaptor subunit [Usitatibacter sp.]|jgi:multidrug efflux system membrane fusion protein|nr:MdtA/MuxA family multidrug efflux RND transporter periplasmic adaptor subunit [Usitatibacter sp.]